MQTIHQTPDRQRAVSTAAHPVTGPMLIAPELLHFIGGGKGVPSAPPTPTAPKNTW